MRQHLISLIRDRILTAILVKLVGVSAGFKAWIIKLLVTELYDRIGEPFLKAGIRLGLFYADKGTGKIKSRSLKEAKEAGNEDDFNDVIDDL